MLQPHLALIPGVDRAVVLAVDQQSHFVARAVAVLLALSFGSIHLVAYWGTVAMVIDLLWLPPVVGMGAILLRDALHKQQVIEPQHS